MNDVPSKSKDLLRCYSRAELDTLDGIINYAERMVYSEGQVHPYSSLRRHAYAKTVVIETELMGERQFRLSATAAVITPNQCGYATPHSPVGRLCSRVLPGHQGASPRWGKWRVTEIRLFDRYDGLQFEKNVRNFLKMRVLGAIVQGDVENLTGYVHQATPDGASFAPPVEPLDVNRRPARSIQATRFAGIDDGGEKTVIEIDEGDDELEVSATSDAGYYGLSEVFYVNRTREQDDVISRSPLGAMYVEGIAGSGKTSAALGRTKMLCDFDAANVSTESYFREILGDDAVYWGGQYAGQFSQESSVGFVRTGELIQYLKETCRRMDLPQLPVQEYRQLQVRLREQRRISDTSSCGKRWAGASEDRTNTLDGTMEWLHAADRAVANLLSGQLLQVVPSVHDLAQAYEPKARVTVSRVLEKAIARFSETLRKFTDDLSTPRAGSGFHLDRIAIRLFRLVAELRKNVLSKEVAWATVQNHTYLGSGEADLAKQMVADKLALYTRDGERLVWIESDRLVDDSLTIVDRHGARLAWDEEVSGLLDAGNALVRDGQARVFQGRFRNSNDLYLMLLPESARRVYFDKDGVLTRVSVERGLGVRMFPLLTDRPADIDDAPDDEHERGKVQHTEKKRSVGAHLPGLLRRRLVRSLQDVAGLYATTLKQSAPEYPDETQAHLISKQLATSKLTSTDIDLLLCLYQIVGRGFYGLPAALAEPQFYQSVFIDEVQDFTEQQIFLMAQQARPEYRAVTVVGDLAQKLHHGSSIDVRACFPGQELSYVWLSENLRQADAPGLALFSACFRQESHQDLEIPLAVVERAVATGPGLIRPRMGVCNSEAALDRRILQELAELRTGQTAAIIFPTSESAGTVHARLKTQLAERMIEAELSTRLDLSKRFVRHFTEVENTKGLEFDVVILPMLDTYDLHEALQRNRLYVGITRARGRLVLLSKSREVHPLLSNVLKRYQGLIGAPVH